MAEAAARLLILPPSSGGDPGVIISLITAAHRLTGTDQSKNITLSRRKMSLKNEHLATRNGNKGAQVTPRRALAPGEDGNDEAIFNEQFSASS